MRTAETTRHVKGPLESLVAAWLHQDLEALTTQCHLHLIKVEIKLSYLKQSETIENQSESEWSALK